MNRDPVLIRLHNEFTALLERTNVIERTLGGVATRLTIVEDRLDSMGDIIDDVEDRVPRDRVSRVSREQNVSDRLALVECGVAELERRVQEHDADASRDVGEVYEVDGRESKAGDVQPAQPDMVDESLLADRGIDVGARIERCRKLSEVISKPCPVWPMMSDSDATIYLQGEDKYINRVIPFKSARIWDGFLRFRDGEGWANRAVLAKYYESESGYTWFYVGGVTDDKFCETTYTELVLVSGDRRVAYPLSKSKNGVSWGVAAMESIKQVVDIMVETNTLNPLVL